MHDPQGMSRFHSDERQVPHYRVGPVFLAGDAAHVHSPVLGQGLNTGVQDAANLGWKLAAAVEGRAAERLLDSYHDERHPVGRQVLSSSGAVLQLTLLRSAGLRWLRDLTTPAVGLPAIRNRIGAAISGLSVRYHRPRNAHRLVGARAPDMALDATPGQSRRLYESLRSGNFVLVASELVIPGLSTESVDVVTPADPSPTATLVRPDGYIAWIGDARNPDLLAALRHWSATDA